MHLDPELKECQIYVKNCKKAAEAKEKACEIFRDGKFEEAIEAYQ